MGRLSIPVSEHRKIRRSAGVRKAARSLGTRIAAKASDIAGVTDGYGVEEHLGSDRVRVNVWPQKPKAVRAEIKHAALLQAASQTKP